MWLTIYVGAAPGATPSSPTFDGSSHRKYRPERNFTVYRAARITGHGREPRERSMAAAKFLEKKFSDSEVSMLIRVVFKI